MKEHEHDEEFTPIEREFSRLMREACNEHWEKEELTETEIDAELIADRVIQSVQHARKRKIRNALIWTSVIIIAFSCGILITMPLVCQ